MSNGTSNVRRNTAIGLTAGLLGGGAIGLMLGVPGLTSAAGSSPSAVVAQEDTPTDDTSTTDDTGTDDTSTTDDTGTDDTTTDETVTDDTTVTEETTTDDEDARPEPGVRLREELQELVDNGTLTSEQADAVATFLVENRPEHGVPGGFPGGPGGFPGGRGRGHGGFGVERGEVAELLGLEPDELGDLLRDGQSLADVATAQGVDVQTVIDTLVSSVKERLDEAVTNERLTQEEADAKLAEITERITEMVNTARPVDDVDDADDSRLQPQPNTSTSTSTSPFPHPLPPGANGPGPPNHGWPGPSAVIDDRRP